MVVWRCLLTRFYGRIMTSRARKLLAYAALVVTLTGCSPALRSAPPPQGPLAPSMPPVAPVKPPIPLISAREVAPGILWRRYSGRSPRWHAPLFVNVLEFDPRDPRYRLAVVAARGPGPSHRESARRIAQKVRAIIAINGSYFHFTSRRTNGDPIGLVLADGRLVNPVQGHRPAMGIMPDGRLFFGMPRRQRDLDSALQLERMAGLGPHPIPKASSSQLRPWFAPGAWRGYPTAATALSTASTQGRSARNASGLGYPWNLASQGLEGGPMLLHDGKPVPLKGFNWSILHGCEPRTAIGLTRTGRMLWLTVDGRVPGHSLGTNLTEVTQLFESLGAVEAMNWDGGGSTTMIIQGKLVTRIATGWVRAVTNALVLIPTRPATQASPLAGSQSALPVN